MMCITADEYADDKEDQAETAREQASALDGIANALRLLVGKLDPMSAGVLRTQIAKLDRLARENREMAALYDDDAKRAVSRPAQSR